MTKVRKNSATVANQCSLALFDLISQDVNSARHSAGPRPGCLCSNAEFAAAMAEDIRHAVDETGKDLTRWDIVARMSAIMNEEITWHMLNNWTAPSKEAHLPELQQLVAFVIATGGQRRAVSALFRPAGIFPLPGPGALRSEIQQLREQKKALTHKEKEVKSLLHTIEKGGHS